VRSALYEISPKPTMLVIAHRFGMMKNADYVYVLKDGSVVEEGAPAELVKGRGWFAELARESGEVPSLV
jgi:ATP-binding cassette subfamily B protein